MNAHRIEIYCKNNNKKIEVPLGITVGEIQLLLQIDSEYPIVGSLVNNKPCSLNASLYKNKTIEFISLNSESGMRIYTRSLVFLLSKAIEEVLPEAKFRVEHPVAQGLFCNITINGKSISKKELELIKQKADEYVKANIDFELCYQSRKDTIDLFENQGDFDTAKMLEYHKDFYLYSYKFLDLCDYYPSLLVPNTSYLNLFDIKAYFDGFIIVPPITNKPNKLPKVTAQEKLYEIFKEHVDWCRIIGANNTADINSLSNDKRSDLIKVSEALHEKKISNISDKIAQNRDIKVVLLAGPSSSGKTTFSKRLAVQLAASGILPITLSLDNYYVSHDKTPKDEDGNLDFESLYALDLELFNSDLKKLINGEEVTLPRFNFEKSRREVGKTIQLKGNQILIMEGIHALNPELTVSISDKNKFKIFISALTTLSLNDHNWIPTSDTRLLRRIIRDHKFRNYSAENTILMWDRVKKGEEKWIFPYQEQADAMFNSALIFEIYAIKRQAEPLLNEVPQDSDAYHEARRLLTLLKFFNSIPYKEIPATSLLREFLGGSGFKE